jgi:hypothetical protein
MATAFSDSADFWNKRFDTPDYIFGRAPNEYLQTQATRFLKKGDTVLCVADGEGRNSVWLAKQGMQVDAFDLSEVALKKAIALATEEAVQVQFTLASSDAWDWLAKPVRCGSRHFYSVCRPSRASPFICANGIDPETRRCFDCSGIHAEAIGVQNGWSFHTRTPVYGGHDP